MEVDAFANVAPPGEYEVSAQTAAESTAAMLGLPPGMTNMASILAGVSVPTIDSCATQPQARWVKDSRGCRHVNGWGGVGWESEASTCIVSETPAASPVWGTGERGPELCIRLSRGSRERHPCES